jgi:hypothetical protein
MTEKYIIVSRYGTCWDGAEFGDVDPKEYATLEEIPDRLPSKYGFLEKEVLATPDNAGFVDIRFYLDEEEVADVERA